MTGRIKTVKQAFKGSIPLTADGTPIRPAAPFKEGDRVRRTDQPHLLGTVESTWQNRKNVWRTEVKWDVDGRTYPVWAGQLEIIP